MIVPARIPPKPPLSNTGADIFQHATQRLSGRFCSIDWLNVTGPECTYPATRKIVQSEFGDLQDCDHGTKTYRRRADQPESGAVLHADNINGGSWGLMLSGDSCQWKGTPGLMSLMSKLRSTGEVTVTRFDVAVDLFGCSPTSIDDLTASVINGQVSPRNRQCDPRAPVSGGKLVGKSVYVGSRSSRQFLRFYDKGLQTKERPEGEWLRWELELKDSAAEFSCRIVESDHSDETIAALAAGFFARVDGPGRDVWLRLGKETLSIPAPKKKRSGMGFIEYQIRRNTAPTIIEAAKRLGMDPYEFAAEMKLFDEVKEIKRSPERESVVRDLVAMYAEHMEGSDVRG